MSNTDTVDLEALSQALIAESAKLGVGSYRAEKPTITLDDISVQIVTLEKRLIKIESLLQDFLAAF